MQPTVKARFTVIESHSARSPLAEYAMMTITQRLARAMVTDDPAIARACVHEYSYKDYLDVTQWTLQQLVSSLEQLQLAEETYPVHEALVWHYLESNLPDGIRRAEFQLSHCKNLAFSLNLHRQFEVTITQLMAVHSDCHFIREHQH